MLTRPEFAHAPSAADWLALKDAVRRFEHAWRLGPRPQLDDCLPIEGSLRSRVLVELAHIDLELRLKAGENARVEDYLCRYPELARDRAVVFELIATEHELRRRREPGLALDEYLQRFPQHRSELPAHIARPTIAAADGSRPTTEPRHEAPPAIAGYTILNLLGRGGMGVVYKARQDSLDRPVALKLLPEACARDPVWLARFRREARTASALNHPHICTIYDTGECAGRPFLSMELIEGRTLDALIDERPPVEELARLLAQAARALAAAHAAGVVHRDIKPANLMVRNDGILKVLDFGLARRLPVTRPSDTLSGVDGGAEGSSGISTDPGARVGTLLYMSPEQARAEPVDAASDIFSLGIVLYELATGQLPFRGDADVGVLNAIVVQTPVAPARLNPEIPVPLEALIRHMLAKDPRLRPSAMEAEEALARLAVKSTPEITCPPAATPHRPTVGRQAEWAALRGAFEKAAAGRGLMLCVTGEPGLGKTTLVESFLEELAASGRNWRLARGRCSERLAGTEAYLPFLEALDSLLEGQGGASAAQAMKLLAPTWYVQLAPLTADDPSLNHVLAEAKEASQERRKRELGLFLQELSRQRPVVVFLDDIHWADPSSVDLLSYLGGRCADWHVLLVLTYRPSDLLRGQHPFAPVKLDLQGRGVCREISLPFLSRDDLVHYMSLAFAGHQFPDELAAVLHERTEGNPLFMVDLLRYLRDRGVLVQVQGRWSLVGAVPDLQRELPESVRGMIQRKVDQLSASDRHLLMAASVQGPEFDSAVVAQVLGRETAEVEERLDVLERVHVMVQRIREQTFPDRTLTVRYSFVHSLYQNALYAALQPSRKAAWSAAAARALLDHYGGKSTGLAAELAMLFEAAHDYDRAADSYHVAAENAARIFGHREAVALARRGLTAVAALPESPERAALELPLQTTLALQLQVTEGFAAPDARLAYCRARELCEQGDGSACLFPVLWGLWLFSKVRSELPRAQEMADELLALARRAADPDLALQAHQAMGMTAFCRGHPIDAVQHVEQATALYDPKRHQTHAHLFGQDPCVICQAFGAVALWLMGYPDRAARQSAATVRMSHELSPSSQAVAMHFAAMLHQLRRDGRRTGEFAAAAAALAAEHGFSFWRAGANVLGGWAASANGNPAAGAEQLRGGFIDWLTTDSVTYQTYYLGLLAEVLGALGQVREPLRLLEEALALAQQTGEGFYEAELYRLRGEFMLRDRGDAETEADFQKALAIAHRQGARSLELRAAMSLTRRYQKQNRLAEARPILARCYAWFTEGFDTPDLQEAKALLEQDS